MLIFWFFFWEEQARCFRTKSFFGNDRNRQARNLKPISLHAEHYKLGTRRDPCSDSLLLPRDSEKGDRDNLDSFNKKISKGAKSTKRKKGSKILLEQTYCHNQKNYKSKRERERKKRQERTCTAVLDRAQSRRGQLLLLVQQQQLYSSISNQRLEA